MKLKIPKPTELIQISKNELADFRNQEHNLQNCICPILKIKIPYDQISLDHKHKRKSELAGINGGGLCRGVIQTQVNILLGKIENSYSRTGLNKFDISLSDILRNIATYLENPPLGNIYIHPNEDIIQKSLSIRSLKKLSKLYLKKYPKRKPLEYPKSAELTKQLRELYKEFELKPEFSKSSSKSVRKKNKTKE